jgi:hypothetical protein
MVMGPGVAIRLGSGNGMNNMRVSSGFPSHCKVGWAQG